jgi:hypothetical protein
LRRAWSITGSIVTGTGAGRWAQTTAARNGERFATQPDTALHHASPAR